MKFIPSVYLRLVRRVARPGDGLMEYMLTTEGVENPTCTIIPVMKTSRRDGRTNSLILEYYLEYDGKVYKAEMEAYLNLFVKLGAQPVEVEDDVPAA